MKSVTVFVSKRGGAFVAETMTHDAIGLSAGEACRRCGAAHFAVDEHLIEVLPHGSHSMIARVKTPAGAGAGRPTSLLVLGAVALVAAAACLVVLFGGAR